MWTVFFACFSAKYVRFRVRFALRVPFRLLNNDAINLNKNVKWTELENIAGSEREKNTWAVDFRKLLFGVANSRIFSFVWWFEVGDISLAHKNSTKKHTERFCFLVFFVWFVRFSLLVNVICDVKGMRGDVSCLPFLLFIWSKSFCFYFSVVSFLSLQWCAGFGLIARVFVFFFCFSTSWSWNDRQFIIFKK